MPRYAKLRKIERTDGRRAKWGISIPQEGSRPKRVFFESAKKRDFEFNKLKRVVKQDGHGVLSASAGDMALLKDLREILPDGVDPREAARFFVQQRLPDSTVPLEVAIRGFLKKQQLANIAQDYMRHLELGLGRLTTGVGASLPVAAITQEQVADLLLGLPFQANTVDGYRKNWRTFFNWCVRQRLCAVSPMEGIDRIRIPEKEPGFMAVEDVRRFFTKAEEIDPDYVPVLALSFFAGMRSSGIARMEREDLDFEQQGIRHRGAKHKSGRRFFVQGFEQNLWPWLEPWRKFKVLPSWPSSTAIKRRERIYRDADVEFPHNAGRHSFCTYHVALHGSADRTATLLTHRGSISVLYDHYRGNATQAAAKDYFSIVPGQTG